MPITTIECPNCGDLMRHPVFAPNDLYCKTCDANSPYVSKYESSPLNWLEEEFPQSTLDDDYRRTMQAHDAQHRGAWEGVMDVPHGDIPKLQEWLEEVGVIPPDDHPNHVRALLKYCPYGPSVSKEDLQGWGKIYRGLRDEGMTARAAGQQALEEWMDMEDKIADDRAQEVFENAQVQGSLPEAPVSANVRAVSPKGYSWQFTVRTFDETERGITKMLATRARLEDFFEGNGWSPTGGTVAQRAPAASNAPACPDHGPMRESNREGWYCPKSVGEHPQTGDKIYCLWRANADGEVYQAKPK
jgi:hypothetical protein